jgi:photosystem II stability/assembly factor-like uncharacterized protein
MLTEGWPGAITTFALVVDGADSRTVFAGTTRGVYRSRDGGKAWQAAGLQEVTVTALVQMPADGTLCAGTEHEGLYCSADRGETWRAAGLEGRSVYALYAAREAPGVEESARRRVWAATDDGVYVEVGVSDVAAGATRH